MRARIHTALKYMTMQKYNYLFCNPFAYLKQSNKHYNGNNTSMSLIKDTLIELIVGQIRKFNFYGILMKLGGFRISPT